MSFKLYAQSTLHHLSKHNLILRTNQFIDVGARNKETKLFFQTLPIFITIFSHITQSIILVLLQGCFKKASIQFKCNNVLCNENKEY